MQTFSKKKLNLASLTLLAGLMYGGQAIASIPYVDHHYQVAQPDGSTLELVLNGSSYYAEQRTLDGYLVVYDQINKGYCYAELNKAGDGLRSSGILAIDKNNEQRARFDKNLTLKREARREQALERRSSLMVESKTTSEMKSLSLAATSSAVTGNVSGLTLLIQFPDLGGTISQADVEDYVNQIGYNGFGNAQSIRDYFRSVSGNQLDYTNTVTRYYTAKQNKSYYTDPNIPFGTRAKELIHEALNWLEYTKGFDFSSLTTDSQSYIKGLNILYAGETDGGWSQGLWPHMGGLGQAFCADGVCASKYQITNMSNQLAIGTFIHESGHLVFGWPDLYDYDGSSGGSVATFGIMGYGGVGGSRPYKPVPPNGYFRHLAGWESVTELNPALNPSAPAGQLFHQANSNSVYRWSNPNKAGEAFYMEARTQDGQNQHLPDAGLAVWHVDGDGGNSNEWHPYVQMEHADANRDPEYNRNWGDAEDLYAAGEQQNFDFDLPSPGTNRSTNSRWWDGSYSGLKISQVGEIAANMSFVVGDPGGNVTQVTPYQMLTVPKTGAGNTRVYSLEIPDEVGELMFTLAGGSGDADLYVKQGTIPNENDNACASTAPNSNESCTLAASPGTWYAAVYAYSDISSVTIEGRYHDRYQGSLSASGDSQIQPDGNWFQYNGGRLVGTLNGPDNADFDLELQAWQNGAWQQVASSTHPDSQESIEHTAQAGYYRFRVYSYNGSGSYDFTLMK